MSPLTHHISRSTWYVLAVIYASMFAAVTVSLVYANHVARESERKWCDTVVTLDETYKTTPPNTEAGKKVANSIHRLRDSFGCDGVRGR